MCITCGYVSDFLQFYIAVIVANFLLKDKKTALLRGFLLKYRYNDCNIAYIYYILKRRKTAIYQAFFG